MNGRVINAAGLVSLCLIACLLSWPSPAAAAEDKDASAKGIGFVFPQDSPDIGAAAKKSGFSLRLYGGFARMTAADVNEGLDGYFELIEIYASMGSGTTTGGYTPVRNGYNFEADLVYQINPTIGVGLGAGYLKSSADSLLTWTTSQTLNLSGKASLSSMPIRLAVFLNLPLNSKLNLTADAGPAFFSALKIDATQRIQWEGIAKWQEVSLKANRNSLSANLGFQGSLGLEYRMSEKLGFFAEAVGRYARFKTFEAATGTMTTSWGTPDVDEGKLYLATYTFSGGSWSMFTVSATVPMPEPGVTYSEPKIDLSGFSLQAGVRVRF